MTSTLQQEGGNKLRLSSSQVMRLAQGLYERGFITYMRTDSPTLSAEALQATRAAVTSEYGQQFLSPQPKQYTAKSSAAQEAHEAIRPTTPYRSPQALQGELNSQELSLYRLIWQRTLASQMADATGVTVSVRLGAVSTHESTDCEFAASGTTITFPGYRAVYVAADDDGDGTGSTVRKRCCRRSPRATPCRSTSLTPNGHTTSPPARYTEASLVKRLEELKIGRPSTWASIIQTIQDRGYVWKKGQALVPTWTAFAVVGLLEQHFDELVDYENTAKIEEDLDEIAAGNEQKDQWLKRFYFGDDGPPARPEAARREQPRPDRRRRDQHVPARPRRERRRDRRQARQVRPVREARRRHRQRARRPRARRAHRRQGDRAAGAPEERRADRRARRLPGVRQERPLRPVRAVGQPRQPAARAREAEDGEPVQDDDARPDHGRRRRAAAAAPALARPRSRPTARRSSPTTAATARTS